ncbi:subtilisin-like protease 4 [Musa acuminata AAA Group]|uniref:subtilisin-like protease 4 n=1 Tax=Musa acuminata AAA Group TaxID=214697 RepID=UPI0031CE8687
MGHRCALLFRCYVFFLFFHGFALWVSEGQLLPIVDDQGGNPNGLQTYIVHVEKPEGIEFLSSEDLQRWHESFLPNTTLDSGEPRLLYSYREAISGFAARLTAEEVRTMEAMDGFVYARPDKVRRIQTTYTPEFLGLSQWNGTWRTTSWGEGIVIGVIDTGIFPSHPSFSDDGMARPPKKFKGSCSSKSGVKCNHKIVGARAFQKGKKVSAIDDDGHGTHVASIAAGNFVFDAEVLSMALGTASGMAPRAHLSIYKACFRGLCHDCDILAAIERAIKDKVNIISMSIGKETPDNFTDDPVAQGSFAALRHQISAVTCAGNYGPKNSSLSHEAPWVLTVGASTTDRRISAIVKLGDGTELAGESAYQPSSFNSSDLKPIVIPGATGGFLARYCVNGSLDFIDVSGKIVVCFTGEIENIEKGKVVYKAGGAAMIIINRKNEGYTTDAEAHVLPASHLTYEDGLKVLEYYLAAMDSAMATIVFEDTVFGQRPTPAVACFSSRGPAVTNGGILKPDVLAPGVNILAAWPFKVGPYPTNIVDPTFNFLSGTSMAAPHVSGIVALIKTKHPEWSPSAIQSAIITSAKNLDLDGNYIVDEYTNTTAVIFAVGAGQVNPSGAVDPGLLYEINTNDYTGYLCGLGYSNKEVTVLVGRKVKCSNVHPIHAQQLNCPSLAVRLSRNNREVITLKRTAKNVGDVAEDYRAQITAPPGVTVELSAYELRFWRPGQEASFQIRVSVNSTESAGNSSFSGGKLEWISDKHVVTCPMAISWT